ncbi:hypothetical protein Tco_0098264 [Tanacetum coccineum]
MTGSLETRINYDWATSPVGSPSGPRYIEGRFAYQGAAPSEFYGGEGGDKELVIVGEFDGEIFGEEGGEEGRRWLCLQGSCMAIQYLD